MGWTSPDTLSNRSSPHSGPTALLAGPISHQLALRAMCEPEVPIVLTQLLGILYLACVLVAVLAALIPADVRRRADARKVLSLLLSALPQWKRQRR